MESKGVRKGSLRFIALFGVLAITIVGVVFYSGSTYSNISLKPAPAASPTPTVNPTITVTPIPTSNTITTPNSGHTVTYSELSRNETTIVIQFKLKPNSYIFQINATSVYLTHGDTKISANTNNAVIIGTQYSTLFFPINGYNGTDYHLSSEALPSDAVWIRQ
jgi:hypothetical protein